MSHYILDQTELKVCFVPNTGVSPTLLHPAFSFVSFLVVSELLYLFFEVRVNNVRHLVAKVSALLCGFRYVVPKNYMRLCIVRRLLTTDWCGRFRRIGLPDYYFFFWDVSPLGRVLVWGWLVGIMEIYCFAIRRY